MQTGTNNISLIHADIKKKNSEKVSEKSQILSVFFFGVGLNKMAIFILLYMNIHLYYCHLEHWLE